MKSICTYLKFPIIPALLLSVCSMAPATSNAQLAANTYQFSALSGTFTEVTGGTAITAIQTDDALSGSIPIGFTFNFCGTDYIELKASSNGWVSFSSTLGTFDYYAGNSSTFNNMRPCLFPLWEDIDGTTGNGGAASYITTGTAPNRIFTLECKNWQWNYSATTATISFQIKLYEGSNLIQYIYRPESGAINTASGGASIGISDNNTPTTGYLSLNNATASPTASGTTFTTNILTKPASGQIYQFKPLPAIDMQADSIVVSAPFCSNAMQPVSARVENLGTATIDSVDIYWTVDGVPQPPVSYNAAPIGNVVSGSNTAIIPLGSVFFATAAPVQIKAWTYMPDGLPDEVAANDTVSKPISAGLQGVEVNILPGDTTICQGTNIVLDAGNYPGNPIYIWSNGTLNQTVTVNNAGTYSVKVQNTDGCFDRDTIVVSVYPNPLVNSIAVIDNGGGSFTFNIIGAQNIDEYLWDYGDGETATGPGPKTHTYDDPGEYTVVVTLKNDCGTITATRLVAVGGGTGVNGLSALQREVKMYPNPAKDLVTITHTGNLKIKTIVVYSLMGQKIYRSENTNPEKNQLNTNGWAAGIYNIMIETDRGTLVKKLEVLR